MSLNGLDDPKVKEAHDVAAAEPGGWFLLKYASRDEVELLGRGNGGIVEVRNAIAQYEEPSPLYGFLRYRRRNVIIKYLPDDCSRLVQARVTVHFNSVCERFAPCDTTFPITTAKELKDTKLSAACSLHTASSSTSSSSSSLRRRRLMEIAEEEEEEQRANKRQSTVREEERPSTSDDPAGGSAPSLQPSALPPVTLNSHLADSPDQSKFSGTSDPPSFVGAARPPSPAKSLDAGRRMSSQTTRPDLYSYSSYSYNRPKVKLGPRPSLDVGGRPRTSAGSGDYRPVASIPAGFKLFSKGSKRVKTSEDSQDTPDSPIKEEDTQDADFLAANIPIPEDPPSSPEMKRPHTSSGGRPTTSSGASLKSTAAASMAAPTKQNTITPEKARLMKAMQLREKKKKMTIQPPSTIPTVGVIEVPLTPGESLHSEDATEEAGSIDQGDLLASNENYSENRFSISQPDSGIDIGPSAVDRASVDTHTDSHPASPLAMSSEVGDSTKASSFSESTDETVQAQHERKLDGGEDEDELEEDAGPQSEEAAETTIVAEETTPGRRNSGEDGTSVGLPLSKFASSPTSPRSSAKLEESLLSRDKELEADEADGAPQLMIPTSKFSTQDAKYPQDPSIPTIITPAAETDSTSKDGGADTASIGTRRSNKKAVVEPIRTDLGLAPDKDVARSISNISDDDDLLDELQSATVEEAKPIPLSKSPINSVFPNFSPPKQGQNNENSSPRVVRTVSNPIRGPLLAPGDVSSSSARAVSSGAAFLHKITQQASSGLTPKKANIGSSISQRIKALEKLSSSSGGPPDNQSRTGRPSSTFFAVRKSSTTRESSRSPSVAERASSLTRGPTPSPPDSLESSPEGATLGLRDRSGSMANRLSVFEGGSLPRGRPESIQVTARIVRDPTHTFPKMPEPRSDPGEFGPLDLKQSPLVVDHHRGSPPPPSSAPAAVALAAAMPEEEEAPKKETIQQRRMSREQKRRSQSEDRLTTDDRDDGDESRPRRRSSLSIVRDFIKERRGSILNIKSPSADNLNLGSPASAAGLSKSPSRPPSVHTTTGLARRLSISSRRSSTSKDRDISTPPLATPISPSLKTDSGDEAKSSPSESGHKKSGSGSKSRASRFMRRLSSSLSSTRKNSTPTISPTVAEEDEVSNPVPPSTGSSSLHQPTIVAFMGDVNVQFPDNLLWKRRAMCLDSQGFLILSTVQGVTATTTAASVATDKQAGTIKRYHLSDFRQPYMPEMEVQELPNSVCLDFVDGSGLQIACEDRAGQLNVLHILQDAHQNHTSFGQ